MSNVIVDVKWRDEETFDCPSVNVTGVVKFIG